MLHNGNMDLIPQKDNRFTCSSNWSDHLCVKKNVYVLRTTQTIPSTLHQSSKLLIRALVKRGDPSERIRNVPLSNLPDLFLTDYCIIKQLTGCYKLYIQEATFTYQSHTYEFNEIVKCCNIANNTIFDILLESVKNSPTYLLLKNFNNPISQIDDIITFISNILIKLYFHTL